VRVRAIGFALTVAVAMPAAAWASNGFFDVTCGDTLSGDGRLVGDCTGTITIAAGHLYLEGHTISGAGLSAIECMGACRIDGPGAIVSAGSTFGISGDDRVRVSDVTISGHAAVGVKSGDIGRIRVDSSLVTGNGVGLRGPRIRVFDSDISGNSDSGVVATTRGVRLKRSFVRNNGGDGVATVLSDNLANRAALSYTNVTGNGHFGIIAKNVRAKRVVSRKNAQSGDCGGSVPCTDVAAVRIPNLKASACDTSMQIPEEFAGPIPFGESWGICTND
jgi:hypothetical protein